MRDSEKARNQPFEEVVELRQRVAMLEAAEKSLRQSEQRYRMLTESTTDMIFILNRSGDVLYANRSAAAGIRYDADSLVGLRQNELFSPEKVDRHVESITRVFETGEVYDDDGMYRFGGEEIWLNTRLMPLRDENGTVTAVMGVARNITDRKHAEAALQQAHDELEQRVEERTAELTEANKALSESEAKYRHLVETTDTGYLILDDQGKVVDANDEYVRLSGHRTLSEIIGRTVVEWTAPYDVQRNAAEVAKCLKAGAVRQLEIDYVGPEGRVIPIEINASVVTGKQGKRIISLCRDITARKQAEEALRQSEQKYKGLVEASPDAVIIADIKGTVLFASHHTWGFLGCSDQEDLVGRSVFDFVIESDRPRLAANIPNLMQTRMRRNTEYTARRKTARRSPWTSPPPPARTRRSNLGQSSPWFEIFPNASRPRKRFERAKRNIAASSISAPIQSSWRISPARPCSFPSKPGRCSASRSKWSWSGRACSTT